MKPWIRRALLVAVPLASFAAGFASFASSAEHPWAKLDPVFGSAYSGHLAQMVVAAGDDEAALAALRRHLARLDALRAAARPDERDVVDGDRLFALCQIAALTEQAHPGAGPRAFADALEACRERGYQGCDEPRLRSVGQRMVGSARGVR